MARSVIRIIFSNIMGFIIFLIILGIANLLIPAIPGALYASTIGFFNANIMLFLIMMLIGLVNDIFWNFYFPFNILAPVTSAALSIFIITFFYRLWDFINMHVQSGFVVPRGLQLPIALFVLLIGYILIAVRSGRPRAAFEEEMRERHAERWERKKQRLERRMERAKDRRSEKIDWEDVGNEFKLAFYNIGKSLNKAFEGKKEEKKKKK